PSSAIYRKPGVELPGGLAVQRRLAGGWNQPAVLLNVRCSLQGWRDEALAHGDERRLRARVQLQLAQDMADVGAGGAFADDEFVGDFLVGAALRDEHQDGALTGGEGVDAAWRGADLAGEPPGDRGVEVGAVAGGEVDRGGDL